MIIGKFLVLQVVATVLIYLSISFIQLDLDVTKWAISSRICSVCFSLFASFFIAMYLDFATKEQS